MIVIVEACRTAIGKYGGSLANVNPEEMVASLLSYSVESLNLNDQLIDEVIIGQTKQSADAPNIARVAALQAGFSEKIFGHTVQGQCGSGMQSIINGIMSIMTGQSEIVIAGGVESMSQAPYYFNGNRFGFKPGDVTLFDSNTRSQVCSQPESRYGYFCMGDTAEWLAEEYDISRHAQDAYALESQQKAAQAVANGQFSKEIVPISTIDYKGHRSIFETDEQPRESTYAKLQALKPVFKNNGTVTAGNSSSRNDGAAVVMLMSEDRANQLGLVPLASIKGWGVAGVSPKEMGIGPVVSTKKALKKAKMTLEDIDLVEINEAFAAQVLSCLHFWPQLSLEKVNVNGGAIALGHPLGCSGTRIVVSLIHELIRADKSIGLATVCVAGGQGVTILVERWKKQ